MSPTPAITHGPVCFTEYGADAFLCPADGATLVAGPAPADGADVVEAAAPAEPQDDEDALPPRGTLTVVDPLDAEETPMTLFDQEERPARVVLTNMAAEDADEFIAALENEDIGAKVGEPTEGGGVQILIHEPNLAVAQAVLVDFTGDESLVDDIEPAEGLDDGLVEIARFSTLDAQTHVERLLKAGIDVTLRPPPADAPPQLAVATLSVGEGDAADARAVLGIAR